MRPDALGAVKNESGSAKHANGTRRPQYRWKWVRERKTWKWDPTHSLPSQTSPRVQNIKTGPDALCTAQNEYGNAKHENGTDALNITEKKSRSLKDENGTRQHWYRRKWVPKRKKWKRDLSTLVPSKMSPGAQTRKLDSAPSITSSVVQNMKMGPDALGTVEKESGSAKHESGTRRPRYRPKRVRKRKTRKLDGASSIPPQTGQGAQNRKTRPA
jgi:hypothetical protein